MKNKVLFSGGPFGENLWTPYKVTLNFVSRLCGCVPREGVLQEYADSIGPTVRPPTGRSIPETLEHVMQTASDVLVAQEEVVKKSTVSFWKVGENLVVPTYSLRAHLKDCVKQVEGLFVGKIAGEKSLQSRVKNGMYIQGQAIDAKGVDINWINRNESKLNEKDIDGYQDRTMQLFGPRGPMSAIKRFAYLLKPTVSFNIFILGKAVKIADINTVLEYGATHGYGGERSMGEGRYTYTIEEA